MLIEAFTHRRRIESKMSILSRFLDCLPYIGRIRSEIRVMRGREGRYPAGHYYSPIPNQDDVQRHISRLNSERAAKCPGIEIRTEEQFSLLEGYGQYYEDLPFTDAPQPGFRYYFGQEWFCYADAIFLYCHLRKTEPRRIVEVGSGFSSAVILDTAEHFLPCKPEVVLIEPNPGRLLGLLRPDDLQQVTVIEDEVQDVPMSVFSSLQAGDLLLIDSSHVVKAGNDLHFLFFDVIPQLADGVNVHFHDVFYPFDYLSDWLLEGRYWNEAYFLRAFLSYNSEWRIRFFNSYVGRRFHDYLAQRMPLCLKNTGGSIYIEKVGAVGH